MYTRNSLNVGTEIDCIYTINEDLDIEMSSRNIGWRWPKDLDFQGVRRISVIYGGFSILTTKTFGTKGNHKLFDTINGLWARYSIHRYSVFGP